MPMLWKQGDWEIHRNTIGAREGVGLCLRHRGCSTEGQANGGACSCSKGECYNCKLKVPDDVKGFFTLVKWER